MTIAAFFMNLLRLLKADMTVESDAPKDIELVSFRDRFKYQNKVRFLLNSDYKARKNAGVYNKRKERCAAESGSAAAKR